LNDFLVTKGKTPASISEFNKFFDDIDLNKDGYVDKAEMARFIKGYLYPNKQDNKQEDKIEEYVLKIFQKYDFNRNGSLDKRECLAMLDEILLNQGYGKTTIPQFNRFYAEFDINNDGFISKNECTGFVRKFLGGPQTV